MARRKREQFAENATNPIFFEPFYEELLSGFFLKGKWREEFFKNENPIVLELGCGKGEYTVGLAEKYPDKNFIGMDLKGARMWRGATDSQNLGLANVAFVRNKIEQIKYIFDENEIDEIWLTFSDPQPKYERRRLSSPRFLNLYKETLKPNGIIHVKTDNRALFDYTLAVIDYFNLDIDYQTYDLYKANYSGDAPQIQTFYENQYLAQSIPINYVKFRLNDDFKNNTLEKLPEIK